MYAFRTAVSAAIVTTCFAVGCSSGDQKNGNGSGGNGPGAGGDGHLLDGVNGQRPGTGGGSGAVTPVLPGDECAGTAYEGEALPLDMLIMMDRSISMGDSQPDYLLVGGGAKWPAVRAGFDTFLSLPQSAGLGVGIDFFGQESTAGGSSCDPVDYSTPDVDIQPLPAVAPDILAAYDAWAPGGDTPMGPALEGALTHAKEWATAHPGHTVIVVLATDGAPHGCGAELAPSNVLRASVDQIAQIPAQYLAGTPAIRTFVLGIEGQEVTVADFEYSANTIATAGGGQAIIVEANTNLATEFSAALDQIRGSAAPPCDYSVPLPPSGETLDLGKVNVVLQPANSGTPEGILNVPDATQCDFGGWYYDPVDNPTSIKLCPTTCNVVSKLDGASFQVLFGCTTQTVIH